jgi:cell pole-organizing protein PopZ
MRHAGEPTVEEILESIKKVIARDNRVGAVETRRQRETEGVIEPEAPAADDRAEDDDVLDLADEGEIALADEDSESAATPLVTDDARSSMQESLAALAMLAQPGMPPQIVRSGETSLEGLVREMLRPLLAEWLEKNLPATVDRLVAAEITRIVGKRG